MTTTDHTKLATATFLLGTGATALAIAGWHLARTAKNYEAGLRSASLRDVIGLQNETKTMVSDLTHEMHRASNDVDRLRRDVVLVQRLVAVPSYEARLLRVPPWAALVAVVVVALAIYVALSPLYHAAAALLLIATGILAALAVLLAGIRSSAPNDVGGTQSHNGGRL